MLKSHKALCDQVSTKQGVLDDRDDGAERIPDLTEKFSHGVFQRPKHIIAVSSYISSALFVSIEGRNENQRTVVNMTTTNSALLHAEAQENSRRPNSDPRD